MEMHYSFNIVQAYRKVRGKPQTRVYLLPTLFPRVLCVAAFGLYFPP